MDYNNIRALLEKYWAGESSLEEEEQLRHFFVTHQQQLPPDLLEAASLFRYFAEEQEREWPEPAEGWPEPAPPVRLQPVTVQLWQRWMQYAAVLLMVAGIGYSIQQFRYKQRQPAIAGLQRDTFNDPEQAYRETQKALQLLARNLNKGTEQVQKLQYFNEAAEKVKGEN